jgi:hypothetical protein
MIAPRIVFSKAAVLIHAWYFRMMNLGSPFMFEADIRYINLSSLGVRKVRNSLLLGLTRHLSDRHSSLVPRT